MPPQRANMPDWYPQLLNDVAARIDTGRRRAVVAANTELVLTYWQVGNEILLRQRAEGWGHG